MNKFQLSSAFEATIAFYQLGDAGVMADVLAVSKFQSENVDDPIAVPTNMGKIVREKESHFLFCLLRLEQDLNEVIKITSPDGMSYVRTYIRELTSGIHQFIEKDATIIRHLKRSEKNELEYQEYQDGEKRPCYISREKTIPIPPSKQLMPFTDYYKMLGREFISRIQQFLIFEERPTFSLGKFFESGLDRFIMYGSWERFFKICDYYSEKRDYSQFGELVLMPYNKVSSHFVLTPIKGVNGKTSLAPVLGQFIRSLHFEGMLVPSDQEDMAQAFIEFFSLNKLKDGKKFVNKSSNDYRKEFEPIFKKISEIQVNSN